jgi:hypothetical protein
MNWNMNCEGNIENRAAYRQVKKYEEFYHDVLADERYNER